MRKTNDSDSYNSECMNSSEYKVGGSRKTKILGSLFYFEKKDFLPVVVDTGDVAVVGPSPGEIAIL